jgi:biotin carboxyl carrier protein
MGESLTVRMPVLSPPDISIVQTILVRSGEQVHIGQPIIEIEMSMATVKIPSPTEGIVAEILVTLGQKVDHGCPLLILYGLSNTTGGER